MPGDNPETIRGYSAVNLLVIDEAARVSDGTMAAVRPMLAVSRGRMLAMSTPHGRQGWFYEASRSNEWRCTVVRATECSRITAEFLEAERAAMTAWEFAEEYLCEFTDTDETLFGLEGLQAFREASLAVPPGALFLGPPTPARELVIDATPRLRIPDTCGSPDNEGHHLWRDGGCLLCGSRMPEPVAGGVS